ncbi:MAG: 3-deoxy-D-manno-octulosonic acid kinase [Woeseia sp.]
MSAVILQTAGGAILFDDDILGGISDADFTADGWPVASPVGGKPGASGRGNTLIVKNNRGEFVLRHFMRGGLIGRFVTDSYLWLGEEATRAFAEWRLLSRLVAMDLPVPRPVGARYLRAGLTYRADLLTVRIPHVVPLSTRMANAPCGEEFWQSLGGQIAAFHKAGVCHADLNAYNVQIDGSDGLWLVDFDRGRLRQPGSWQQKNLARLNRSLNKIKRLDPGLEFGESDWRRFLDGYFISARFR